MSTFITEPGVPLLNISLACGHGTYTLSMPSSASRWTPHRPRQAAGRFRFVSRPIVCRPRTAASWPNRLNGSTSSRPVARAGCSRMLARLLPDGVYTGRPRPMAPHVQRSDGARAAVARADEWALRSCRPPHRRDYLRRVGICRSLERGPRRRRRSAQIHFRLPDATPLGRGSNATSRPFCTRRSPRSDSAPRSSDTDEIRAGERSSSTRSNVGNDPDVVRDARATLDRALGNGQSLEATVGDAVVHVAARTVTRALRSLVAAAERAPSRRSGIDICMRRPTSETRRSSTAASSEALRRRSAPRTRRSISAGSAQS